MKYDDLVKELRAEAYVARLLDNGKHELLYSAATAIEELQSTVVIVEVKENNDGT